jgi:hypothetical protein
MTQHFASLKQQIDSPAHQIRSSLLHAMGHVIAYIHSESESLSKAGDNADADAAEKQKQQEKAEGEEGCDEEKGDGDEEEDAEESSDSPRNKEKNIAQLTRVRDAFLDLLVERTHDVSPWTRANVLKVWMNLLETHSVPVRRIHAVAELAVDRLQDKAVNVRLYLISCLSHEAHYI